MRYIVLFYSFCLNLRLIESRRSRFSSSLRIMGGRDASETEYPYIVRLQYHVIYQEHNFEKLLKILHSCTGSVLTLTWTLTAAHCFVIKGINSIPSNVVIRPVIKYDNSTGSNVKYTVKHPGYLMRMFDLYNDIGLIKHEPIKLKMYARVSGLDYLTIFGQEVTLTGYGTSNRTARVNKTLRINNASDATTLEIPLQLLDAVVVPCDKNEILAIKLGMCLARRCGSLGSLCLGDSGGPVLHPSGVVGINSIAFVKGIDFCKSGDTTYPFYDPGGITPTSPYIDWISSTIKND